MNGFGFNSNNIIVSGVMPNTPLFSSPMSKSRIYLICKADFGEKIPVKFFYYDNAFNETTAILIRHFMEDYPPDDDRVDEYSVQNGLDEENYFEYESRGLTISFEEVQEL